MLSLNNAFIASCNKKAGIYNKIITHNICFQSYKNDIRLHIATDT